MEQKFICDELKKIEGLSELELEKRDLYLRGLNTGAIQGTLTGCIYLDKPFTKWYREKIAYEFDPYNTLYTTFANSVKGREDEIAVAQPDKGVRLTYGELLDEVDKTAAGMVSQGIRKGSIVAMFFSDSIQEEIFLLATNKLGAVSKWIDYTKEPESLFKSITEAKIDMLVLENMLKPLEAMINPGHIPTVICDNEGPLLNYQMSYDHLIKWGTDIHVEAEPYEEGRPAVIISSSGTTGEPKPIVHTDAHINFAARRMMYSNYPLDKDHIVMLTIPPHIGLGLITTLYTNLISGAKIASIHCNGPEDSMNQVVGFLLNYKEAAAKLFGNPDLRLVIFGAPIHVRVIASVDAINDLSFLDGFLAAGSKISEEELKEFDKIYAAKGCKCPISNGYGQNEMAGAVAINDQLYNLNGAAGFPVIGTEVLVIDEKTGELLPPGVQGKIIEKCNSAFLEYYGMPEKTEEAWIDFNGDKYFDTKDLGFINEDGFLFITGRTSRVLVKFDTKISLDKIEQKVRMLPFIKDCAAIASGVGGSVEKLILFIEPTEDAVNLTVDDFNAELAKGECLGELEMPDKVVIMPIPYMTNSKIDYQQLKGYTEDISRTRKDK